jgi:hypothetical protein
MAVFLTAGVMAAPAAADFGIADFDGQTSNAEGGAYTQAGGHPFEASTTFKLKLTTDSEGNLLPEGGTLRGAAVELPPGLIGSPAAAPTCTPAGLVFGQNIEAACSPDTIVGTAEVETNKEGGVQIYSAPVFNMTAPKGMPARFAFVIEPVSGGTVPVYLNASIRSGGDYGVTLTASNLGQAQTVLGSTIALWGDPADPAHDEQRCVRYVFRVDGCGPFEPNSSPLGPNSFTAPAKALLRLPTACTEPGVGLTTTLSVERWESPSASASATFISHDPPGLPSQPEEWGPVQGPTGCADEPFKPSLVVTPSENAAESPTGLHVDLHLPQGGLENPTGISTADLKRAVVTLPSGVAVNPSAANGLVGCSEAQIGFVGTGFPPPNPIRFDAEEASCPEASKIGTVEVDTPLLDHPLSGSVYVAQPFENPFASLLAIYLAVDDPQSGVVIKLPGRVQADSSTGQLTATFDNNPQLPFEDFKLEFFAGQRAVLSTPPTCGRFTATSDLTPWSAPEGADAWPSSSFEVGTGAVGSRCLSSEAEAPSQVSFEAGSQFPIGGTYSPFVLRLSRRDGTQRFGGLELSLPPGLTGRLAGIPYCSDDAIAAAERKSGKEEQMSASCPQASEVGQVMVAAGTGSLPYQASGHAYLAGPYKGALLSLAIITPAVAGPFDLGDVVVRVALFIDPETAQITAKSDPLPTILQGIPLDIRSVEVRLDRHEFTLNPTSCEAKQLTGSVTSPLGKSSTLSNRFQVGGCNGLEFKPKLQITLKGSTKHTGHPALKAVVTYPKRGAYANIRRAQVNLPHSEFLDQGNLNKTCTKPVLLEGKCPKATVYGRAKAWTPLLEKPLEGNVYLVGGYGYKLPALVAELNGQIRVVLKSKVDSGPNKGIRTTFEAVPDAPVSRFVLEMKGGKKYSLFENSENLCRKPQQAIATFTAQSGAVEKLKPKVANECRKVSKKH